jgi:peptidyl-prolyl cis-trans isomerase B (cyclophilin B)
MTTPHPPQQPGTPHAAYPQNPQGAPAAPQFQQPVQQPAAYRPQASTATTLGATNTYAVLAIVFGFLVPIAGIVFGHMGLNQIKRNGDPGRGLALTGLIVGYAYFAFIAIFIVVYIGFIAMMIAAMGSAFSGSDYYY